MKVDIYSEKGTKGTTKAELVKEIFEIKPNDAALRQLVRVYQVNQRAGTVSTKTRSEVSGGGRKPWAQKGTGRARHGSTRSPIWFGGGITFGPRPRTFELSIPKRIRELALRSALSQRAKEDKIFVISNFSPDKPKTAEAVSLFNKIKAARPLLVVGEGSKNAALSLRNLSSAKIQSAQYLNAYDVLESGELVFTKAGLAILAERLSGKSKPAVPVKASAPKKAAVKKAVKAKKTAPKSKVIAKKAKVAKKTKK